MSGEFPASWLSLREPFDQAARSAALVAALDASLPPGPVRLVDLGCGLGSNLRFTSPRLQRPQHWTLLDKDLALLAAAPSVFAAWAQARGLGFNETSEGFRLGVNVDVRLAALDLDDPSTDWPDADVITTQALLDLVSEAWLARLAERVVDGGKRLLATLSVDGRVAFHPSDPDDDSVMARFRAHQHTDRGFGPSPGPHAALSLAGRLRALGRPVRVAEADWRIGAEDRAMAFAMVDGIAGAAATMDPSGVADWAIRRHGLVAAGGVAMQVGHLDLLA